MFNLTNVILIGDMHVKKDDVEESRKLIEWVVSVAKQRKQQFAVIFMGDQYNDFAVARVEALEFWKWAYDFINLRMGPDASVSIVGNHDMNQDESASAMSVHSDLTVLVQRNCVFLNPTTVAIGFIRKEQLFYDTVMSAYKSGARTVFCHAEFQGAQYENGFYAPHGFNLAAYPPDLKFVSGHIHKKQSFGNVTYVGTPRPLTRSDIGEVKGIHIANLATGTMEFIPTPEQVCEPFTLVSVDEGSFKDQDLLTIKDSARVYVDIKGSKEFTQKIAKLLPDSVKVRSSYSGESKPIDIKESEGIPSTFIKFSASYFTANNITPDVQAMVLSKIYEECPSLKIGTV